MANTNIVSLIIKADGSAAIAGINRVNKSITSMGKTVDSLSVKFKSLAVTAAGALGIYSLTSQIKSIISQSVMLSSRVETLGIVMETVGRNAGYSARQMNAYMESVKKMGITTQEAHQTIIKMTQAQLDLSKSSQLARVAQDAAVIGNINSSEALGRLLQGITTLNPVILRNIGIVVNLEQEYKKFADTTGRTVDSLTAMEKQQIVMNAVIREGEKIAGTYEASMKTVGKQLGSLARLAEEAMLKIGEIFKPALSFVVVELTKKLKELEVFFTDAIKSGKAREWANSITNAVKTIWSAFETLGRVVIGTIKILHEYWDLVKAIAIGMGSYFVLKFVAATGAVTSLIWALRNLGFVLQYLVVALLPYLKSKLGVIGLAIGAVSYVFMKLGNDADKARMRIDQLKYSLYGLSEAALRKEIRDLEIALSPKMYQAGTAWEKSPPIDKKAINERLIALKEMLAEVKKQQELEKAITKPPGIPEPEKAKGELDKLSKMLADFRDRERLLGLEDDAKALEQLKIKHEKELGEVKKLTKDKAVIDYISKVQQDERAEFLSKKVLARMAEDAEKEKKIAQEVALAKIQAEQSAFETRMTIEEKLDQYRLKAGTLREDEAIRRRYERERDILTIRQETLIVQMSQEDSEARLIELQQQYYNIAEEIKALSEYETYELNALKISQMEKINKLREEEFAIQRQGYENIWKMLMDTVNQIRGEEGQAVGLFLGYIKGLMDIETGQDTYSKFYEEYSERMAQKISLMQEMFALEYAEKERQGAELLELQRMQKEHEAQVIDYYNQIILAQEQVTSMQRIQTAQMTAGLIMGVLNMIGSFIGKHNKVMFILQKAAAIAITLINTKAAAVAALAPPPLGLGPKLGQPLAAKVMAYGYRQAALIAATAIGQAVFGHAGGMSAPSKISAGVKAPTVPEWRNEEEKTPRSQVVNVHVYGNIVDHDAFARELVPAIQKATSDGVR